MALKSKILGSGSRAAAGIPKKSSPAPKAPAVTRFSMSGGTGKNSATRELSVRQIDNGYIIRDTTYGAKGGYKETERFSATAPKLDANAFAKGKK